MKLSEFVKLSMNDMNEYVKKHINPNNYYAKVKSLQYPAYTEEHNEGGWWGAPKQVVTDLITYYDIWTDGGAFDIEADECGWEIIPIVGALISEHELVKYERDNNRYPRTAKLLLKKKSDNGLILFVSISADADSHAYTQDMRLCICGGIHDGHYLSGYSNYPIVLIDKNIDMSSSFCNLPMIANNPRSSSYSNDKDYTKRIEELSAKVSAKYPFAGIGEYVYYPSLPTIRSYKTSKFNLFEYGEAAESYAKVAQDNMSLYINECVNHKGEKDNVYNVRNYMSYKNMFADLTWEDFTNLKKLMKNDTEVVTAFLKKCKASRPSDYAMFLYSQNDKSNIFKYAWDVHSLDFNLFTGIFSHLVEYRKIVADEGNYKDTLKAAKDEYTSLYTEQAQLCGAEISKLYDIIADTLNNANNVYGKAVDDINDHITKKYKTVKKDIVLKNIDMTSLKDAILKKLETEMKTLGYKHTVEKTVKKEKVDSDKMIREIAKKIFDLTPNSTENIVLYCVKKAYDAPYEVYESDDYNNLIYGELEDAIGGIAADELFEELYKYTGNIEYDGNSLYPGEFWQYVITRDLKFEEVRDH